MIEDSEGFKRTQRRYIKEKQRRNPCIYWYECKIEYGISIIVIINDLCEEWNVVDRLGRKVYGLCSRSMN